jgi:hypothetical protein
VPGDPRIRAADADRDRAAALLREHHAAGRLTAEEFHDRMEKAMDAATLGQLDELMADLPAIDLYELPAASLRRAVQRQATPRQSLVPVHPDGHTGLSPGATALVAWGTVAGVLVAIGIVTAAVTGAVTPWLLLLALLATPIAAVSLIRYLIRRSQR